jgi:hypothetical protein
MDAMIRVKERGEMMTRCLGKKPPFATPKWDRDCINQNMDHYRHSLIEAADELELYAHDINDGTISRIAKEMKKSARVRK